MFFKKGKRAGNVQWVGVTFSLINADRVSVGLPEPFMKETISTLQGWASKGYVALKALRTVAGRMSWVAGVLPRTRWTVAVLYAVLTSEEQESKGEGRVGSKVQGMFPVKRLEQTRLWIIAYLEKAMEHPLRVLELRPKKMADISITTDASPECLGGLSGSEWHHGRSLHQQSESRRCRHVGIRKRTIFESGYCGSTGVAGGIAHMESKNPAGAHGDSRAVRLCDRVGFGREAGSPSSPGLNFLGAELGIALVSFAGRKVGDLSHTWTR